MEEEQGLTLSDICRIVLKRIWWALGAAALGLLVCVLLVNFLFNTKNSVYTLNYELVFPECEQWVYPDGSAFKLSDVISQANLEDIVKDEQLKGIDVKAMVQSDSISVFENEGAATTTHGIGVTLTVASWYFSSDGQASAFLKTVADSTERKILSIVSSVDYGANLSVYASAASYDDILRYFSLQKSFMSNYYNSLISQTSETFIVNGKSLSAYKLQSESVFSDVQRSNLEKEIAANCLVIDAVKYIESAADKISSYKIEIEKINKEIEMQKHEREQALSSDKIVTTDAYDKAIVSLTSQVSALNNKIDEIYGVLGVIRGSKIEEADRETLDIKSITECSAYAEANAAFKLKLDGVCDSLLSQSNILNDVSVEVYKSNTSVTFRNNRIVKQGGTGLLSSAVLGAVAGFVFAAVIICIVEVPRYKRRKRAVNASQPRQGEDGVKSDEVKSDDGTENK